MNLRRTRKGWQEIPPKHCANGHELRGGSVLVGTQHCICGRTHRTHTCRTCGDTTWTPADWLRVHAQEPRRAVIDRQTR